MLPILARIGRFLSQSKIFVIGVSFVSLILISAVFSGHTNFGDDESVKGVETVDSSKLSPTPTPILVKPENRFQSGSMHYQPVTNTVRITIFPTPTPVQSDQPSVDQKTLDDLQVQPTPSESEPTETSTTQVSCTFANGVFTCQ